MPIAPPKYGLQTEVGWVLVNSGNFVRIFLVGKFPFFIFIEPFPYWVYHMTEIGWTCTKIGFTVVEVVEVVVVVLVVVVVEVVEVVDVVVV